MSFGVIGTVVSVGATLLNMGSQAKAGAASAEANEAVFNFNAAQTRDKAKSVRKVGAEGEFELRTDMRRQLARNRVATATGGAEVSGSPLESELLVVRDYASDITTLAENTRTEAQDLEGQASFFDQQAKDARAAKRAADRSPGGFLNKTTILGKIF